MDPVNSAPSPGPAETAGTPSISPDDALHSIASEISVEEQARTFTATPQPTPNFQQQYSKEMFAPDPVTDSEGYKRWATQQAHQYQSLDSAMRDISTKITAFETAQQQQRVNADVDRAVQVVNQKAKVDPDVVEAMLNVEYTKNPSFKKIFDNREKNPMAYQKALGVISDKIASKFQIRTDPQLAENVRAAQASQRTMATTNKTNDQMEQLGNMNDLEFQRWWQSQIRG
jgi:hypothetical protein